MTRRHGVIGGPKSGKLRRPVTKVNYPAPRIEVTNPSVVIVSSEPSPLPMVIAPEPIVEVVEVVEPVKVEPIKAEPIEEISNIAPIDTSPPLPIEESEPIKELELKPEEENLEANHIEPEIVFGLKEEIKEEAFETKEPMVEKPKTEEPKEEKKWGRKKGWKKNK